MVRFDKNKIKVCYNLYGIWECWLFDLIDFKLQGNAGLCYRSIRMLESHWGFDSDNDDIDFYIIRHMRELQKKIIEEEKVQTEAE